MYVMRNLLLAAASASALLFGAGAALAAPPPPDPPTQGSTLCTLADISPSASDCVGWYEGNLNGGSPEKKFQQAYALNTLLGTDDYTQGNITWLEDEVGFGGDNPFTVNFATLLTGLTVVSFHVGGAVGQGDEGAVGYSGTAFYAFNAGAGLDTFTFNLPGLSNARLYSTGGVIPEPATWALMILGFGGAGAVLRHRRRPVAA